MRKMTVMLMMLVCAAFATAELQTVMQEGPLALRNLEKYKRALAMDVAAQLGDARSMEVLVGKLSQRNASADLIPLLRQMSASRDTLQSISDLDKQIREAKGIADRVDSLLQIRLAFPERGISRSEDFLVSYIPAGNEKSWKTIEAFDTAGNIHQLDVLQAPDKQVLVVGLDARKDLQAGLEVFNEEMRKAEMQWQAPAGRDQLDVAKLNYIRLEDDQEPWISGDAEIYALVNGISPEASKANVIAMEMPYLDTDKKDYYPNQVLIVWNNYRYKAANINLYEHDDSANYKEIAALLIQKIGAIVPEYQTIFDIASQIIKLMPDSWFVNDDDYVDVYYTLEQGKTYTNHRGASRNATMTLVPYVIPGE